MINLPIKQIRDYFGERIALYFKFLGFYTKFLIVIAFLGYFKYLMKGSPHSLLHSFINKGQMKIVWPLVALV